MASQSLVAKQHTNMQHPERGSIKRRALRAGGWTALGFGVGQAMRLAGTLVMTRLLVPEMFGIMAIATMITVIIGLMSDLGIKQNIIQSQRGEEPAFLDTAWTVQILRGVILWALVSFVALLLYVAGENGWLPAHTVYGQSVLPAVMVATSFSAVIAGFNSTKMSVASRNLDQRELVCNELASQVVSLTVMGIAGALTHSIWSLVAGQWAGAAVTLIRSHTALPGHRNRLRWDAAALHEIAGFGKWVMVSSFIGVFALQADRLLFGAILSADAMGQYAIASTLVNAVQNVFRKMYSTVAMPALSEIARDKPARLEAAFYRLRVPADLALLLGTGVLAAVGSLVVDLLYDARYRDAGWMLQILAVSLVWTRYGVDQQLYIALGRPKYVATLNIANFVVVFVAIWLGFRLGGVVGALWGFVLHPIVTAAMTYRFNRLLGITDVRCELAVLFALPVGYGIGLSVRLVL